MKRQSTSLLLAGVVALFFICLFAGSALAAGAQLCSKNETPCTVDYPSGTKVEFSLSAGTKLKKFTELVTPVRECSGFTMSGSTAGTGSGTTPVEVPLSTVEFTGCTCPVTVLSKGRLIIENIPGTMNAKVRWAGFEIKEKCSSPETECILGPEASKGIFLRGGAEPVVTFEYAVIPIKSGYGLCGNLEWSSTNAVATPKPLYISGASGESFSGGGVFCRWELGGTPCFPVIPRTFGSGTSINAKLKAGTTSVLNAGFPIVKCEESSLSGEVQDPGSSTEPIVGALSVWTFGGCNCKVTVPSAGNFSVDWTSGQNGALILSGFETKAECGSKECIFGSSVKEGVTFVGGNPAAIKVAAAPVPKKSGIAECNSSAEWAAEYEVTAPKPVYVGEK